MRGGRRSEELAAAAGRTARLTTELAGGGERELAVREASADSLNLAGILAASRRERDAPGHEHARQVPHGGQGHHHGGQALVAGGDTDHSAPGRERPDQPPQDLGGVIAIGQRVHHSRRPLCPSVAGVAAVTSERDRALVSQLEGSLLHQQPDLEVTSVVAERDRRAVLGANAALRAQNQVLVAAQRGGVPSHSGVLRPTENVAAGQRAEHRRSQGKLPGRPFARRLNIEDSRIFGREQTVHGLLVWRIASEARIRPPAPVSQRRIRLARTAANDRFKPLARRCGTNRTNLIACAHCSPSFRFWP